MPITARCPGCGQTLSVEDRFGGMQGKCPTCGTILTFPAPPVPVASVAPPAAGSYAAGTPSPGPAPAGPPVFGTPFSLAGLDQVASITLPVGLFFLLLEILATLLPWRAIPLNGTVSGLGGSDATLLLFLCLLVGALAGSTFFFKDNLRLSALTGAAFGTFVFFVMIAEVSHAARLGGGTQAGLWIGLLASIGILAPFVTLAVLRPLEWRYLKALNIPPVVQQYGAVAFSQAAALAFGILYLLVTAVS